MSSTRDLFRGLRFCLAVLLALGPPAFAAYNARLWFENHTTGQSGPGAVTANIGDEIWVNFSLHKTNNIRPIRWTNLQVFIDLENSTVISGAEANIWDAYVGTTAFPGTANYPMKVVWQPSDGDMYNDATHPGDNTQPLVTHKGLYCNISVLSSKTVSQNIDVTVFKFHVASGPGQELHFGKRPGSDVTGIWTQLVDENGVPADVARGVTETGSSTYTYGQENWLVITENVVTTSTAVTAKPNPCYTGDSVSVTATVTPPPDDGTVEFFDGADSLGTSPVVSGSATMQVQPATAGTHTLVARFSGTQWFLPSSGGTLLVVHDGTPTATVLTATPNACYRGDFVSLTAAVSPVPDGGTVEFFDGTTSLGTASIRSGTATLTMQPKVSGTHVLTARFGGTDSFKPSSGTTSLWVYSGATTTTELIASPDSCRVLYTVRLTATVSPIPNGGWVEFFDGSTSLGTSQVVAGVATVSFQPTTVGKHDLTAQYGGTAFFDPSSGSAAVDVVNGERSFTSLRASPNPCVVDETTTLTATVTPTPDGGIVEFLDDVVSLGWAPVLGGVATMPHIFTTPGTHRLQARFSGTTVYNPSSGAATLTVRQWSIVTGYIYLDSWMASPSGIPIDFWVLDGDQVVDMATATLSASNIFSFVIPLAGTYSLRAKAGHWLSQLQQGVLFAPGGGPPPTFELTNGDANGDNWVGFFDLSLVLSELGSVGSADADLDGSGTVGLGDLAIVLANLNLRGD